MNTRIKLLIVGAVLIAFFAGVLIAPPQVVKAQAAFIAQWLRDNMANSSDGTSLRIEYSPTSALTADYATTDSVEDILSVQRTSSGAPSAGIGTGVALKTETAAGNNETGLTLDAVTTDVTSTSEDFDLVIGLMDAGAAAAERWRLDSGGVITQSAESAATNSVIDVMNIKHGTSGTEANGIGLGLVFTQEVTSGDEIAANLDVVATDVTAASEDFSYIFSLMAAGAAAAQVLEIQSTGIVELAGAATLDNSTAATELNITETNIQLTGALDLEGGNVKINEDSGDYDFAIETDSTDNAFSIDSGNSTLETDGVTVTFNQAGGDYDFTIESDDNAAAFVVDAGNDTVKVDTGLIVSFKTADPCTGADFPEGSIFYNSTANVMCYCSASNADLKFADDSACF